MRYSSSILIAKLSCCLKIPGKLILKIQWYSWHFSFKIELLRNSDKYNEMYISFILKFWFILYKYLIVDLLKIMKALYTTQHIFTKKALYILQNKKDFCKSTDIVEYIVLKKSFMSSFLEDSWILVFAFNMILFEVCKENLAPQTCTVRRGKNFNRIFR